MQQTPEEAHFLRRIIQPALLGLMDGSVSTLAPLSAAAFATKFWFSMLQVVVGGVLVFLAGYMIGSF